MSQISVSNLTFYYDGSYDNIFTDVSFQIDSDWKLGFIARNGRGKTTFLNLLQRKMEYKGNITASVTFDYFPYVIHDKERDTIEIVEQIDPEYEFWKICKELMQLKVDTEVFYRKFSTLSNGEQTKVMLAILFSKENNFLLIDEPTNHLDMETRELVKTYLNTKKGFILVSHDRNFMNGCIDHVLVINKESIEVQQGDFDSWWENKKRQDAFELAQNEKLKKEINRLTISARQASDWADNVESTKIGSKSEKYEKCIDTRAFVGEKSRRMQQRRKNLERRQQTDIEEKSKLLKNIENPEVLKILPMQHYKNRLVTWNQVSLSFGEHQIFQDLNMTVENGDRIALCGRNGCGKSSVLKMLAGVNDRNLYTGTMESAGGLVISYVPQDASFLTGSLNQYARENEIDETLFKAILRKLDFSRVQFEKSMQDYSGGQKKKVLIAKSLCERAHLYLWDEPLNYIDVFSRMQIEELILQYKPTMIFVEHDSAFVEKVATKEVVF